MTVKMMSIELLSTYQYKNICTYYINVQINDIDAIHWPKFKIKLDFSLAVCKQNDGAPQQQETVCSTPPLGGPTGRTTLHQWPILITKNEIFSKPKTSWDLLT